MKVVRFIAVHRQGDETYASHKITMLAGLEKSKRIASGEWVGYLKAEDDYIPFVLRTEEHQLLAGAFDLNLSTTMASRAIEIGEMFSIGSTDAQSDKWESVYQITSVHAYS